MRFVAWLVSFVIIFQNELREKEEDEDIGLVGGGRHWKSMICGLSLLGEGGQKVEGARKGERRTWVLQNKAPFGVVRVRHSGWLTIGSNWFGATLILVYHYTYLIHSR